MDDTITAISTAAGAGGIGIVRLSGLEAIAIADRVFIAKNKKKLSALKSHTVNYGWVVCNNEIIDEALMIIMRAPKSYTKEDVVEIHCHGGTVSLRAILQLTTASGARLAEPGEFTKRAFLNGRIDLAQAEAVLDVIQSKTDAFLRVSTNQLKGELSTELEAIRQQLMDVYIEIEAVVNFPEDDIDSTGREKVLDSIDRVRQRVKKLLETSNQGRILKDGIKIVLCGKPNVGKSSLLNVLLKTPRAIVSDIAGTTRDTIEETAQIKGIPFQLVDTAGILEPRDLIEEEAIKRSHMYIKGADLVLLIFDASAELNDADEQLMDTISGENIFIILNKSDLKQKINEELIRQRFPHQQIVRLSVLTKSGVDNLESAIVEQVWHGRDMETHGVMISNVRHIHSLESCLKSIHLAKNIINEGTSLEFASEEIKHAVNSLDNITGRNIDQDLLDNIFSQFCIGK